MRGQTATSTFALTCTTGFFFFECLLVTLSDWRFSSLSKLLHLHHWLCFAGGCGIVLSGCGYSFATRSLALEMSTPFSCVCWMLLKLGWGRSHLWTANQLVLLHTFHLRSVIEVHMWWITYCHWAYIWAEMPWAAFLAVYVVLVMFTFLATPYWGYKKTLQLSSASDWNFSPAPRQPAPMTNGDVVNKED